MVVRNIAIFTGGAVLGAVAMTTYFKSKDDTRRMVPTTASAGLPASVPTQTPPQVPVKAGPPPPLVPRPPPNTSVANPRTIMPHGFP
ncbi:hypothetical protein BGZ70_002614, partial [Mortierella alpina]